MPDNDELVLEQTMDYLRDCHGHQIVESRFS